MEFFVDAQLSRILSCRRSHEVHKALTSHQADPVRAETLRFAPEMSTDALSFEAPSRRRLSRSELSRKGACIVLRLLPSRDLSVGALPLVLIVVLLVGGSMASAAPVKQFTDRHAFNTATINRTVIDF